MKPQFEHVTIPKSCSIRVFHRQIPEIPFEWHHHPEWELTLTLNSRGLRFMLVNMIRATWSRAIRDAAQLGIHKPIDTSRPHAAIIIWFSEPWALQVADLCPEYSSLRKLLKRAAGALSFPLGAGEMMEARVPRLLSGSARECLQTTVDLLAELADTDAVPLAVPQKAGQ